MKRPGEAALRILTLLRLDAQRLFERIKYREPEYMMVFSQRRTREHFPEIFKNRYDQAGMAELQHCGEEVIVGLDQFYNKVDELRWYLNHTQDMPGAVADHVSHSIAELEQLHEMLQLYINAELGLAKEEGPQEEPAAVQDLLENSPELEENFALEEQTFDESSEGQETEL